MNSKSIIKAPTFARDGIVNMMVLNITRKNFALVISLNILPILKALAMVVYFGPISRAIEKPMMRVI